MSNTFKAVEQEMNSKFFERKEEIRGLLVALLSKQHILLLGAPGTGKSAITEDLCKRIDGQYFKKLVSRTTTPEELFGPVSLKALENDSYKRVTTGKLPEATISFIDEIFKCNSAVLNGMLGILNEREFENDGQIINCPLQFAVGASNELPEDREELGALWDRFLLRYEVKYIRDGKNFEAMLQGNLISSQVTKITYTDLQQAQIEVNRVDISKVLHQFSIMRQKMTEKNIPVSDRRWRQTLNLVKANAYLEGRTQASDDDLEILVHALWQDPSQIRDVRAEIMNMANPLDREAQELFDEVTEVYNNAMTAPEEKAVSAGTEAIAKMKKALKRYEELRQGAIAAGRSDSRITGYMQQAAGWNQDIASKCLGL